MSLSTGKVAAAEVQADLLEAKEKGKDAYNQFISDRLMSDQPSKQFHDRLPKLKINTFSDIQQSKKAKTASKEVVLKADHKNCLDTWY